MAKDCSPGRRDRAAGVKGRCTMETPTAMSPESTAAKIDWQCLLVMVAGTRAAICSTRRLYLRRSFHRASRVTEGRRNGDGWVGSMVVVVMMLKMVTMLLKTTRVWMC